MIFFCRHLGIKWQEKNCRRANLAFDHYHLWKGDIVSRTYKISCLTYDVFFPSLHNELQ